MIIEGEVGPQFLADGTNQPMRQGRLGEAIVSELHGRYYEQSRRGNIFFCRAISTALAGIASSNGIGGPLLWNGSSAVVAVPLAMTFTSTVVTTVAASIGLAFGTQSSAPTSTTAIDSSGSGLIGGTAPAASAFRLGTVSAVPSSFFPLFSAHTGALTVDNTGLGWIDLGGAFVLPTNTYLAVAASATATTLVAQIGLLWEEVPV